MQEASSLVPDPVVRSQAERALLLARAGIGLSHEGKNPLHNMALHLQLLTEKLGAGAAGLERHLQAMRLGIERVDAVFRLLAQLSDRSHAEPDLAAALDGAASAFHYDLRRMDVKFERSGPARLPVDVEGGALQDLVAHALLGFSPRARGGPLHATLEEAGSNAILVFRADEPHGVSQESSIHIAAAQRLAAQGGVEFALETPPGAGARLSLSMPLAS